MSDTALRLADDRPNSVNDDLYQWAIDAEEELRRLHALNAELVEALRGCVTALNALWQPADSIYTRAADAADRALAKVEASNG